MYWRSHWLGWSLSTLGRSLLFSRLRFPPREYDEEQEPFWHGERIRFLPWSDVRAEPFCHSERIWFLTCQIWVLIHSDVTVGLVSTWSDVRDKFHSRNGGTWSLTRKTQSGTKGHSEMIVRCSPTWLDVSAWPFWYDWGRCSHLIRYKG